MLLGFCVRGNQCSPAFPRCRCTLYLRISLFSILAVDRVRKSVSTYTFANNGLCAIHRFLKAKSVVISAIFCANQVPIAALTRTGMKAAAGVLRFGVAPLCSRRR